MAVTIRIPIPQNNQPFMRRARGIGAFFASRASAPVLPAPSIFSPFARKANGLGSFVVPASYPLPAASVFSPFARRGLGYVARGRRFPRRGLGDLMDINTADMWNAYPISNIIPNGSSAVPGIPVYDAPTVSLPITAELTPPAAPTPAAVQAATPPSTNPALDAFNQALSNQMAAGLALTPAQTQALSQTAGAATAAQLATMTQQLTQASPSADAFSQLWASIQRWFGGSSTLFGSTFKNTNLVLGGAAGVLGLALLSSAGGRKKRRK